MKMVLQSASLLAMLVLATPVLADESVKTEDEKATEVSQEATQPVEDGAATDKAKADSMGQEMPEAVALMTGSAGNNSSKGKFSGSVALSQFLGIGTFVSDEYVRNSYYGYSLTIRPRYFLLDNLYMELTFSLQGELTESYQTSTTYPRQVMPSDLFLLIKGNNVSTIPVLGINFSPYLRLGAPTSYESQHRDMYLSIAPGFDLSRMFGKRVLINYGFRFSYFWHGATNVKLNRDVALARIDGAEDAGGGVIYGDTVNPEFSVFNRLMTTFILNNEWSITLLLGIQNTFMNNVAPSLDEFSSEFADGGRGQSDSTMGVIDLSYQPFEHVGFSLGLSSSQPAKTADNKSFRFPFFDFSSEANNFTQVYFDVYASF